MADANATLTAEHDAYLGLGVGRFFHRAYAVGREGTELPSRRVANSEAELGGAIAETRLSPNISRTMPRYGWKTPAPK